MRGLQRDPSAALTIEGQAFIQNLRRGHYEIGIRVRVGLTVAASFDELARHLGPGSNGNEADAEVLLRPTQRCPPLRPQVLASAIGATEAATGGR